MADDWSFTFLQNGRTYFGKTSMNKIIEKMTARASMFSGEQKKAYEEILTDIKAVKVVPLKEVFSESEVLFIKKVIKPRRNECYKNAFQLTMLFPNRVKYCEGETTVKQIVDIGHAWNKVDDKYVDITMELALGHDMDLLQEDYALFGEWDSGELLDLTSDMEFYGGVYIHSKIRQYEKKGV